MNQTPDSGVTSRCRMKSDCPDRQDCNVSIGVCYNLDACGPGIGDCPPPQMCGDGNDDGYNECIFDRCTMNSQCAQLTCAGGEVPQCVAGGCICGTPCMGGCPSSQGCCIPEDRCHDLPAQCRSLTCSPGQIVSVTATGAWSTSRCEVVGETCECVRLPALPLGDIGLHSAVAHDGRAPILSAYNLDYGDLMYGELQGSGTIRWEFVDGIPTSSSAAITGDVDGPRGGVSTPGEDVGLYTDIAADTAGRAHIVYHDRTKGDLKYAINLPTGWAIHTVAESGTAGYYNSLTFDRMERPIIAFLTLREGTATARKSSLRIALTSTLTPRAISDWVVRDLTVVNLVPLGCEESCNQNEVCRASDLSCVVPDPPTSCNPACDTDRRCIGGRCVLIDPLPPFRDLPMARGLWPSVQAAPDGGVFVAYYDRFDRALRIARVAGPDPRSGTITTVNVDGAGTGNGDDTGLYPSMLVTPAGEIHLVYMNATRRSVVYKSLDASLRATITETIESGIGMGSAPGGELVGADPAIVVDAMGSIRVAFQNATTGELRYARREGPGRWNVTTLRGNEMPYQGTYGFYTDQALGPDRMRPVVSSYRFFLAAPMGPRNGVEVVSPP